MKKLLEKAAEIDDKYGHLSNSPIGKKMKYYYLDPEVSGGPGDNTIMDTAVHPPAR